MSDETPTIEHEAVPPPAPEPFRSAAPAQVSREARSLWVAFGVLAVLGVLGLYLVWSAGQSRNEEIATLQNQLEQADGRVAKLEAVPPPPPPAPPVDLTPLRQAVAELESKVTALANKPPPAAGLDDASRQQLAAISGRMDSLTARQDQLGSSEQADIAKLTDAVGGLTTKLASLSTQVDASTAASGAVTALSAKEGRTAQLQAAAAALAAGRPLGTIPDAPPALAKFATQPPPTEASLRLSFETAADAARTAGQPTPASAPFLQRMWQRAQSSVTVKAGNTLVVGDALSGTLDQARHLLEAGDLAGAVAALGGLSGPAAQAMAPWTNQAQSLLDARAALISAAGH